MRLAPLFKQSSVEYLAECLQGSRPFHSLLVVPSALHRLLVEVYLGDTDGRLEDVCRWMETHVRAHRFRLTRAMRALMAAANLQESAALGRLRAREHGLLFPEMLGAWPGGPKRSGFTGHCVEEPQEVEVYEQPPKEAVFRRSTLLGFSLLSLKLSSRDARRLQTAAERKRHRRLRRECFGAMRKVLLLKRRGLLRLDN